MLAGMAEARNSEQAAPEEPPRSPVALAKGVPSAQPPVEARPPDVGPVQEVAGGVPAIISSLQHVWGEAGPIRGTRLLLKLNQKDCFDCPGCAWPDPDAHRSVAE